MEGTMAQVMMFAGNFAPRNWAFCQGQLIAISSNSALFSLVGTIYGGDGRTTFGLPDLRGRVPVGTGNGPGLNSRPLGQKGGAELTTLSVLNLPPHSHAMMVVPGTATSDAAAGKYLAEQTRGGGDVPEIYSTGTPNTQLNNGAVGNTGNGQSFNNLQPYLAMNYVICLQGVYPSRS